MNNLQERILYQNNSCVVINKLAGEAVQSAPEKKVQNLIKKIKNELDIKAEVVQAVHRLDVPVTGCVLIALTKNSLSFLGSAFAAKDTLVEKKYWAIAEKNVNLTAKNAEAVELTHWIEVNPRINKSFAYNEAGRERKKAVMSYKIIGEGTNYLFLEIELFSGRHHQIRAQLAAVGLHIKGDVKYGAKRSEKEGGIRLHARSLLFPNPLNKNERISLSAVPPVLDNLWLSFIETCS